MFFIINNYFKKVYNIITNSLMCMEDKKKASGLSNNHNFTPQMSNTSKWILLMLFAGGNIKKYNEPVAGRIRLIKEIFLFLKLSKITEDAYDFKPYKYGPFANEFLFDLNNLKNSNLIYEREGYGGQILELTSDGIKYAKEEYEKLDDNLKRRLIGIKIRFNKMSLNELLSYVYSSYPKYAEKSEYNFNNSEEVY